MAAPAIVPMSHSSIQAFRSPSGAGRVIVQHEVDSEDYEPPSPVKSLFQKLMKFAKKSPSASSVGTQESVSRSSFSLSESRSSTRANCHQRAGSSSASDSIFSMMSSSFNSIPLRSVAQPQQQQQHQLVHADSSEEQFQSYEKLNAKKQEHQKSYNNTDADSKEEEDTKDAFVETSFAMDDEPQRVSIFTFDGKRSELISTMLGSTHQCDMHVRQDSVVLKRSMSFSSEKMAHSIILEDSDGDDEDEEEYMYISTNMSYFPELRHNSSKCSKSKLWALQEEEDSASEDEVI